jgi:ElaA protein
MKINWHIKHFNELSINEFHDLLQLRLEVFVVEQNCVYQDLDGKDPISFHVLGEDLSGKVIATTRIIPINELKVEVGRVVVNSAQRKDGIGQELMEKTIEGVRGLFGDVQINIGAQKYLLNFYTSLGFIATNNEYLEDGIPHIEMNLN